MAAAHASAITLHGATSIHCVIHAMKYSYLPLPEHVGVCQQQATSLRLRQLMRPLQLVETAAGGGPGTLWCTAATAAAAAAGAAGGGWLCCCCW
jgi:hypothetical protein